MDAELIIPIARVIRGRQKAVLVMNSVTHQINIQSYYMKGLEWVKGPTEFNLTHAPKHIAQEIISRVENPKPMSDELNRFCHTVLKIAKQRNNWFSRLV